MQSILRIPGIFLGVNPIFGHESSVKLESDIISVPSTPVITAVTLLPCKFFMTLKWKYRCIERKCRHFYLQESGQSPRASRIQA